MPNHFVTVGLCARDYAKCEAKGLEKYPDLAPVEKANLCELVEPIPPTYTTFQARAVWGTKWGTYATQTIEIPTDGLPVIIQFASAWRPPSPEIMRKIDDYLCETYCLRNIKWIGHDPYDNSTVDIEVAERIDV